MTYEKILYGVPGVIEKMAQAQWFTFGNNGKPNTGVKYFDGIELFDNDFITDTKDKLSPIPCSVGIRSKRKRKAVPIVKGFVSEATAAKFANGGVCILGHRKIIKCRGHENEITGEAEVREPFTTAFDGAHTVPYKFVFTIG